MASQFVAKLSFLKARMFHVYYPLDDICREFMTSLSWFNQQKSQIYDTSFEMIVFACNCLSFCLPSFKISTFIKLIYDTLTIWNSMHSMNRNLLNVLTVMSCFDNFLCFNALRQHGHFFIQRKLKNLPKVWLKLWMNYTCVF